MKADDSNPEAWLKKHEKELRKFEDKHPRVDGKKVKLLHNPEEAYARTQKKLVSGWESQIISTETPEEFANWDECSDARDIRREVLLTERQRKVLDLLREGHSRADIARMLKVSRPAVTKLCNNIHRHMRDSVDSLFERVACTEKGIVYTQSFDAKPRGRKRRLLSS